MVDGVWGQLVKRIDGHSLNFCLVLYWNAFVRLVLWEYRSWMFELEECLGDVFQHVEGDGAFGVIPVDVDAAEKQAAPVHGDCEVFLECHLEMHDVVE